MSTLVVDTWRTVKIWTKNLTDVLNEFLPLIQVSPMIQNKTEILNLKTLKTQVPIGYLTLNFIYYK
jgi:adenine-specific DNA methylase